MKADAKLMCSGPRIHRAASTSPRSQGGAVPPQSRVARPPGVRGGAGLVLLLAMLTVHPAAAAAADADPTQTIVAFDTANKFYEQGRFSEAARAYQALIESGRPSATLHFNAGNAWFKAGQTGRAIAAYRQAERLAPRDPNIQFNLNFARKRVTSGETTGGPLLDRVVGALTLNEWTTLAAGSFWAALLLLAAGELRAAFRPASRRYAAIAAIATALSAAGAAGSASRWFNPGEGVIVVPDAIVRSGPLEEAKVLHQFRDGTEVKILDQKKLSVADKAQTWFQVRNNAAQSGWIRDDQLVLIR